MPRGKKTAAKKQAGNSGANIGYEAQLWQMADALRGSMDAAEYKHVVLGLIFLKYISDAFEEHHARLEAERAKGADPEDPDEYRAVNAFWVPKAARWLVLQANAKQPTIGKLVDDAMEAVEKDNPSLKGVLPRDYARPALDKTRLGQLIDLVSNIKVGDEDSRSKDVLGRVYEYFLSQFASAEGKKGGEFYTPRCIVRLLVEMIEPFKGRVYDPCCGSSGMFVQSDAFIRAHGGRIGDIAIYGQESNYTTWRLAKMNLAIRGIEGQIAHGDSFHNDRHPDLKADFILANPPFNVSDWGGERLREDKRWKYGVPPAGNANFAWVQHMIHHLSPTGAGRSSSSTLARWGRLADRTHRELTDEDIARIADTYHAWRGAVGATHASPLPEYRDIPGFCKAAKLEEIRKHGYVLTPGRYVGAEAQQDDGEPFEEKMQRLVATLREQQAEAAKLDEAIARNLASLGFWDRKEGD